MFVHCAEADALNDVIEDSKKTACTSPHPLPDCHWKSAQSLEVARHRLGFAVTQGAALVSSESNSATALFKKIQGMPKLIHLLDV